MHDNNILSGSDWYSIQAFRAINQALGRCIRHKNDWGAIILLEDRFQEEKNLKGLSKWLRNRVQVNNSFHEGISSLQKFVQTRLAIDKEAAALLAENAKKDQQVALPSQSANTTQETTIIKDEEVENTVPPLSQNFSEDTSLDGIIAETLNSIIETEKRLESNYLAYKNASRREATFPDFTPVVPSAACAITETVSQLIVNHITNPIRDSIVSPITNPISNPITNPIVNPTANPIVNPITCPISKPVTGLPFITQNDNISTTKEESDTQDNTIQALKEKTDTRGKHLHTLEEKIDTQDSDYHTLEEEDITQITTKLIPKIENKMDSISIADNQGFSGITSTIDVQHTTLSAPSKENRNHYESYTSKGNTIYKEQNSQSPKNSKKSFKDLDDVFKDIENDTNDDAYDEIYDDMDYGMDNDLNDDMNAIFKDMGDGMDDDLNDDMDAIFKDMYLQESHIPTAHSSSNSFQHKGNNVYPVLCKDCQCTLMIGNINFLKISNDPLLNCMVSLTKKGDLIVEVENPSSWETFGLCMDASQLPNETQVYMNRVDQLFYQKINCNCGKLCGIIVCGAMVIEKQIHVGKVLLLNSAIVTQKEKAQVGSVDIEDDDELWGDISPSEVHQMVISSQMLQ
ncbi:hypothetical protein G6F56_007631 [Rhizopus delemar]|nr:hypothetical protein G6F56_007631 [Rhizopus delemar]